MSDAKADLLSDPLLARAPVYGASDYRTNGVSHRVGTGKNGRNFLAQLAVEHRCGRCVLVLDKASYRTSIVVAQYLKEMTDSFEVAWLPPYCPELNDIERIWKYVKGAAMANHDPGEVGSLREAVDRAFDELNRAETHDLTLRFRDPLAKGNRSRPLRGALSVPGPPRRARFGNGEPADTQIQRPPGQRRERRIGVRQAAASKAEDGPRRRAAVAMNALAPPQWSRSAAPGVFRRGDVRDAESACQPGALAEAAHARSGRGPRERLRQKTYRRQLSPV